MNAEVLIAPVGQLGLPAPLWFIVFFKVLGFTLHAIPMSLWFSGLLLAMGMHSFGGAQAKNLAKRLIKQMPAVIAFGVNLGLVPLLFTQVSYYQVFYPATILMAIPWLSVIFLLIFAYYGVYICASSLKPGGKGLTPMRALAGWVSALLFIAMGINFSSAFALMSNVGAWGDIWQSQQVGGAVLGSAAFHGGPGVLQRYLMMFGISLIISGGYIAFDTGMLARRESEEYRRWAMGAAFKIAIIGAVWFAVTGSWYTFGTWTEAVRSEMFSGAMIVLTILTAISPALVLAPIFLQRKGGSPMGAIVIALGVLVMTGLNAISRQIVQNIELRPYLDFSTHPVNIQWSPLILFLVLFVLTLGVVVWMIAQVVKSPVEKTPQGI